jgi:hypothetical protein
VVAHGNARLGEDVLHYPFVVLVMMRAVCLVPNDAMPVAERYAKKDSAQ